jgi:hypothetical protein
VAAETHKVRPGQKEVRSKFAFSVSVYRTVSPFVCDLALQPYFHTAGVGITYWGLRAVLEPYVRSCFLAIVWDCSSFPPHDTKKETNSEWLLETFQEL